MASHHLIFSHGKESGPWGSKIKMLAETGYKMGFHVDSIDYQGIDDVQDRVQKLIDAIPTDYQQLVLVGSSMGAYVAVEASATTRVSGLFLLAPAVYLAGYPNLSPRARADQIEVVHGWHDSIVPVENAIRFAQTHQASCHLLDDEHRLMPSLNTINELFGSFLTRCLSH